jgi:hypothetical protein
MAMMSGAVSEACEETRALLAILAMGASQIESGQFQSMKSVFANIEQEDRRRIVGVVHKFDEGAK